MEIYFWRKLYFNLHIFSFFDFSKLSAFISDSEVHIIFAIINDGSKEGFASFKLLFSDTVNCSTSLGCLRLLLWFLVHAREEYHQIKSRKNINRPCNICYNKLFHPCIGSLLQLFNQEAGSDILRNSYHQIRMWASNIYKNHEIYLLAWSIIRRYHWHSLILPNYSSNCSSYLW